MFGIIAIIILIVIFVKFNKRITSLEENIRQLRGERSADKPLNASQIVQDVQPVMPSVAADEGTKYKAPVPKPPYQDKALEPNVLEQFVHWFAHDWPLKTGAFLILLGFVWLVSYAFLNNWIGPAGRITLGIVVGTFTILGGDYWMKRSVHQAVVLESLGAAITLVTVFAAQSLYSMFIPPVALTLSASVMVLTGVSSIRHDQKSLIIIALVSGGLAPILTGSSEPDVIGLFSYLLAIVAGSLWVVRYKNWRFLTPLSLALVWIYSSQAQLQITLSNYAQTHSGNMLSSNNYVLAPMDLLWLKFFALTFITLFFLSSLVNIITTKNSTIWDLITAGLVGFYALGWITAFIPEHMQGLATLLLAIVFMEGAYISFKATGVKHAVYVYAAVSVLFLFIATTFEFQGESLMIALSAQAIILSVAADKLFDQRIGVGMLLYFLVPISLSLEVISSPVWSTGVLHKELFSLVSLSVALGVTGHYYLHRQNASKETITTAKITTIAASVYGLILIWLMLHALILSDTVATTLCLVIYTLIGLYAYISGQVKQMKILERYGFVLLILVISRLLLVEVWDMPLAGRIITFFVIGLLLIGSVLLRKQTHHE